MQHPTSQFIDDRLMYLCSGALVDLKAVQELFTHTSQLAKAKETIKYIFVLACAKGNTQLLDFMLSTQFPYNLREASRRDIIIEGLEECVIKDNPEALDYLLEHPRLQIAQKINRKKLSLEGAFLHWGYCFSASRGFLEVLKTLISYDTKHKLSRKTDEHITSSFVFAIQKREYEEAGEILNTFAFSTKTPAISRALKELQKNKSAKAQNILTQMEKNFLASQIKSTPLAHTPNKTVYKI